MTDVLDILVDPMNIFVNDDQRILLVVGDGVLVQRAWLGPSRENKDICI